MILWTERDNLYRTVRMVNQGETRWDENEGGLGKKRVERKEGLERK
jgi:hypothetical protein